MTRINVIPVSELNNQMLLAEYRELPKTLSERTDYTLGAGHVKFFYMYGQYLKYRFEMEIVPELQNRGFKLQYTQYRPHPDGMNNDYVPTEDALRINRERINERLNWGTK